MSAFKNDREHLRELAKKQMEYAAHPSNGERKAKWFAINDGKCGVPPVAIETGTFFNVLVPPEILKCQSDAARAVERGLLKNIREFELINHDAVTPDYFPVNWHVEIDLYGKPVEKIFAAHSPGFSYKHIVKDIEKDLPGLKPAALALNREATEMEMSFLNELIGDIMPVILETRLPRIGLTANAIELMGMENFYVSMHEQPKAVHAMMRYLTENQMRVMKFYEANGLLTVTNGNQVSGPTSRCFTNRLPASGYDGKNARLVDVCLWCESQETVGISQNMFYEFCLPYSAETCALAGTIYYGCCEPVDAVWDKVIERIPNIAKAAVSPWCDEAFIANALKNTGVVYSRKPSTEYFGARLDEEGLRASVANTLKLTAGMPSEILLRDIYTIGGVENARRAVDIVKGEIERAM